MMLRFQKLREKAAVGSNIITHESTRVSAFHRCHIDANPTLFRDPSVQKQHFRLGENNTFVLHSETGLVFVGIYVKRRFFLIVIINIYQTLSLALSWTEAP